MSLESSSFYFIFIFILFFPIILLGIDEHEKIE